MPWPPPMHADAQPSDLPDCSISRTSVSRRRVPVAPSGWPSAIAPPFTLHLLRSRPSSFSQPRYCAENASLISTRSRSPTLSFAFSHATWIAGTGPRPMTSGGTPARPHERMRAFGFKPSSFARAAVVTTSIAAPSTMPDALPAVTVPSLPNAARSARRPSIVVSGLMWSSVETTTSFLPAITVSGAISAANLPAFTAAAPSMWLRSAYSSCSSREIAHFFATFSAVCAMKNLQNGS